jgi:hypothetical protein
MSYGPDRIPLPLLSRALRDRYAVSCSYRSLYNKAVDGTIPADWVNGRWSVDSDNLQTIASKLRESR